MPTIPVMRRETIKVEVDEVTAEKALALSYQGWMPVEVVHGDRAYWMMPNLVAIGVSPTFHRNSADLRQKLLVDIIADAHDWAEREGLLKAEDEG